MKKLMLSAAVLFSCVFAEAKSASVEQTPKVVVEINDQKLQTHSRYFMGRHNFGDVPMGHWRTIDIWIQNNTRYVLDLYDVRTEGWAYSTYPRCGRNLYPSETCVARVNFRPEHYGMHRGLLKFELSNGTYYFELEGWGF